MIKFIGLSLLFCALAAHAVDRTTCPQERTAAIAASNPNFDLDIMIINKPGTNLREARGRNVANGGPVGSYIACLIDARIQELEVKHESGLGTNNNARTNSSNIENSRPHAETDSIPEPSDSQPVMNCVVVSRPEGSDWASMFNKCSFYITVDWCYVEAECGISGGGNIGNIAPKQTRKASTFISKARKYELRYSACSGRDKTIVRDGPQRYFCK